MKKHFSRVLAMVLVLVTLVATFAVPASAAGSYPMSCSIYYKDESGKTVATTKTFSMNAADTTAQQTKYYSPTVSGYALKNSSDSYVTYTAYKVVLALVVKVPPALYDALVALLEVLQPWKV